MKIPLPNLLTRTQQLQTQPHQRRITLLQTRRRRLPRIWTSRSKNRARVRAFEAAESADQRDELLGAGSVDYFGGGAGLDDGVGYVEDGNFHCEDLFLEGVVDAVCWDGGCEEGGEVGELHGCGLMMTVVVYSLW